jgi:hypothetical protein
MIRLLTDKPDEILRFRANPWPYQQTFLTPLKDLNRFVSTVLAPFLVDCAVASTDEIVFTPEGMLEFLANASIHVEDQWRFTVAAEGQQTVAELLEALLGDWIDFLFIPTSQSLAIYADHDEYTTLYCPDEKSLHHLSATLVAAGYSAVKDYQRGTSDGKWR